MSSEFSKAGAHLFYVLLKKVFIGPFCRLFFRPWIGGEENIPDKGAALIASNHLAFCDSFFLPLVVSRKIYFLAKAEYFNGKGIKGRIVAAFFRAINQIPLDRSGGTASAKALQKGVEVLRKGQLLGIYPEGTRSPDGRLHRGKFGVARLTLTARVPVIPVAMIGTDKVQPLGKKIPRIHGVGVVVGEPLDFSRYYDCPDDRFVLRSVTDEIMYEIMRLSGQEYVDVYGSTVKEKMIMEQGSGKERRKKSMRDIFLNERHGRKSFKDR